MSTSEKLEEINIILKDALDKDDVDLIDAVYEILKRI